METNGLVMLKTGLGKSERRPREWERGLGGVRQGQHVIGTVED